MMPGVGFAEMVVLVLVAIVVIGPKDLPLMMRKFTTYTNRPESLQSNAVSNARRHPRY